MNMIRSLDPSSESFLNGLAAIQNRAQAAQRELTTGRRINTASDDPGQISLLLELQASLARNDQIQSNLGRVKTETDSAESALEMAAKAMDRAQVLAAQAQPTTNTAATRATIAGEIGSLLQQIGGLASTQVEGRYIFSGDSDSVPPYTVDLSQNQPVSTYAGGASTRKVEHPDGTLITVARTAQDVFDAADPKQNIFASLVNLRTALLANDQSWIDAALPVLNSASTYLEGQLAFYGTVQNRVADGIEFASNRGTQLKTEISGIQDADLTDAIVQLTQAKVQEDAALSSRAKLPRGSLFDFLG